MTFFLAALYGAKGLIAWVYISLSLGRFDGSDSGNYLLALLFIFKNELGLLIIFMHKDFCLLWNDR